MPWVLPESDDALLRLAKGYPYAAPAGSYLYRDGASRALSGALDPDLTAGRVPVIAHGSNRAPEQLHRKFGHLEGAASEIPVTRAWLADHDVVYSAHMTRYGSISATLHEAPGTRVQVYVTWLTEAQLPRMHETEIGAGNYGYGRMSGLDLAVEGGPRLTAAFAYLSVHGSWPIRRRRRRPWRSRRCPPKAGSTGRWTRRRRWPCCTRPITPKSTSTP